MRVFITSSNAKRIIHNMDLSKIDVDDEVYKINFAWFSLYDIKHLLAFKLLYENPEKFFRMYKKRETIDTKQYVFEGINPAYHYFPDCQRIQLNFINYKIPQEIKEMGYNKIEEFRDWFKVHQHLLEEKEEQFIVMMQMKFGLKEKPEIVSYKNSGIYGDNLENLVLNELEERIDKLIRQATYYIESDVMKTMFFMSPLSTRFDIYKEKKKEMVTGLHISYEQIWQFLKEFDERYRTPIKFLLREYYRVKYNPDLAFDGKLLEQLGFRSCSECDLRAEVEYPY